MHAPVVSVMQTILVMYFLWGHLQWACLTGIAMLILFVPFQGLMGRCFQAVRRKTTVLTDTRIRIMNEIINGMRVIKVGDLYVKSALFQVLFSDVHLGEELRRHGKQSAKVSVYTLFPKVS